MPTDVLADTAQNTALKYLPQRKRVCVRVCSDAWHVQCSPARTGPEAPLRVDGRRHPLVRVEGVVPARVRRRAVEHRDDAGFARESTSQRHWFTSTCARGGAAGAGTGRAAVLEAHDEPVGAACSQQRARVGWRPGGHDTHVCARSPCMCQSMMSMAMDLPNEMAAGLRRTTSSRTPSRRGSSLSRRSRRKSLTRRSMRRMRLMPEKELLLLPPPESRLSVIHPMGKELRQRGRVARQRGART